MQGASFARFATLAALIVSAAVSLWLAAAGATWIVVGVATAWLAASIVEWIAWNRRGPEWGVYEREWRLRSGYDQPNAAARPVDDALVQAPPPPEPPAAPTPEPDVAPGESPPTARALRIGRLRIVLRGGADGVPDAEPAAPEPAAEPVAVAAPSEPASEAAGTPDGVDRLALLPGSAAEPEPEPEPEPQPEPPPAPPSSPVRAAPEPEPEPEVVRPAAPAPSPPRPAVARLSARRRDPHQWNLWELERLARDAPPDQAEEWHYLFVNLRRFAEPDGALPVEFDSLVRESFEPLLDGLEPA